MKLINEQLDKKLFEGYYILRIRLYPRLRLPPHPHLRPLLPYEIIDQIDNDLFIGWEYGDSVLEIL